MATTDDLNSQEELPVNTTGEPTDQLSPDEAEPETDDLEDTDDDEVDDIDEGDAEFDEEPIADEDEDLDDDEVKRLFPSEDDYTDSEDDDDEEPYEGIRHGDKEDEGLVDDNMSSMPVIPSPS
jgi:hypothetical protein